MIRTTCVAALVSASLAVLGVAVPAAVAQAPAAPAAAQPAWPADQAGLDALGSKLVDGWMKAVVAKDAAALEAQMQPCFQRVSFEGAFDRAGEIAAIQKLDPKDSKISDVHATRAGDALVVTCQVAVSETAGGSKLPGKASPRLGVWTWSDGAWKLAAWASLNMPEKRPAPGTPAFAADAAATTDGSAMLSRYLGEQRNKEYKAFDAMMDDALQVINFKGQKLKADIAKGAEYATVSDPVIAEARGTRCGTLTIVTCNLAMSQKIGFTSLPADPAPYLAVFQGSGDAVKAIALANTNKPK